MDLNVLLAALRARFHVFALALASTVVAATAVTLLLPDVYLATASLLVAVPDRQSLSGTGNDFFPAVERPVLLQTQIDIIKSPRVALKVMNDLGLTTHPGLRAGYESAERDGATFEEWLIEGHLLAALDVTTSQSRVIHIGFHAEDADYAAALANAFAKAYADTMLELRVEPTRRAAEWFDEQRKTLRAGLVEAQDRLTTYQQEQGIVSASNSAPDIERARFEALASQVLGAEEQARKSQQLERQARENLSQDAPLAEPPDLANDEAGKRLQRLRGALLDGQVKLEALGTQFGVNHPTYRRQVEHNRKLLAELEAEMHETVAATESVRWTNEQREAELRTVLENERGEVLARTERHNAAAVLARHVESAQSAYATALHGFLTNQVEGRANDANITVIDAAAVPREPFLPSLTLNVALAFAVGTTLGLGLLVLLELADRRVRSAADLAGPDILGSAVPELGTLGTWHAAERPRLAGASGTKPRRPDRR